MQKASKRLRFAVLAAFALMALAMLLAPPIIRGFLKRDRIEAAPQFSTAKIEMLVPARSQIDGKHFAPRVFVRFQGKLCPVRSVYDIEGLEVGQEVRIMYRIGKTGWTYVESVMPEETASTAAARNGNRP